MKIKFLDEVFKVQTKENLKELRQILKPIKFDRKSLLLGKMTDDNLGVYYLSGNDSDFTKTLILTLMRDSRMGVEIFFCAYTQTERDKEPRFSLVASKFESNPKSARNFIFNLSRKSSKFLDIVSKICSDDKFVWYQPQRQGFRILQYIAKNLPLNFRLPF